MIKTDYKMLSDVQIGDTFTRPLLVTAVIEGNAKNGNTYCRISLRDGVSEETAMMFDTSEEILFHTGIKKGVVADVSLTVSEYQGNKSFKINSIVPTADFDAHPEDFIKSPPIDPNLMYNEICTLIRGTANDYNGKYEPLSGMALRILEDNKSHYMTSSAAISMHHNFKGGLLYHSYRMVKAADALCTVYTDLDRELLLCATALHDIGKIWEYKTDELGEAEQTNFGILFGHLYMGAALVKGYTTGHNYNMEKVQMLIHLILSHHGTQEFGTVACPALPEAFVLHYVDNIDAKLYMCENFYDALEPGTFTEKRPFGLDNKIYKPKYE